MEKSCLAPATAATTAATAGAAGASAAAATAAALAIAAAAAAAATAPAAAEASAAAERIARLLPHLELLLLAPAGCYHKILASQLQLAALHGGLAWTHYLTGQWAWGL